MSRATRPDGPLDHALERLRAHGLPYKADIARHDSWISTCPVCRPGSWSLRLREAGRGGAVTVMCAAGGCPSEQVLEALEREPIAPRIEAAEASARRAWEVAEQAREVAERALRLAARAVDRSHDRKAA